MLAALLAFVTSCRDGGHPGGPTTSRVANPGQVLFSVPARSERLSRLPPDLQASWCPAYVGDPPRVVSGLRTDQGDADTSGQPFALAVMADAGAALAGDQDAAARLIRLLDRWARADALWEGDRRAINRNYALDRTLLPTIVAFATIRDRPDLPAATRARIETWLGRLVGSRLAPPEDSVTRRNNHYYLRGSVDIAWGTLVGDPGLLGAGIAAYRAALAAMRPDGSLPLETARGARALWYHRHSIASLVVTAEIAANQGIDLYAEADAERDLHGAIRFLLDAVEDPGKVLPYAAANDNPGTERDPADQDLTFLDRRGHERHYMAWVEIYAARFPDRAESGRLLELLARTDPGFRPMLDEYSGGATTCFFALPSSPGISASSTR